MRILIVHNRYRSAMPSGENRVVDDETELLRGAGHDVHTLIRDSDEIANYSTARKASVAISFTYSRAAVSAMREGIGVHRPDVVHLHNPFPLISPWVIRVAKEAGLPVVHTVHNYRRECPAGTFYRAEHPCTECKGMSFPYPAVAHGCYRDSRSQSFALSSAMWFHRKTWNCVDHFLATSPFVEEFLIASGVDRRRVSIKPNFTVGPATTTTPGDDFVFIGRLSPEKGIQLLLDGWKRARVKGRLLVVGDGPLASIVQHAASRDQSIVQVGGIPASDVPTFLLRAGVVVLPSVTYEGFPRLLAEAFAYGRPVVATRVGSLKSLVTEDVGWLAEPTPDAIAEALRLAVNVTERARRGRKARLEYERSLTPLASLRGLELAYGNALRAGTSESGKPVGAHESSHQGP